MNLGRGFSLPQENAVQQKGGIWAPVTPEKPVLQRNKNLHSEIPQYRTGQDDWRDLLGMYSGLLQDELLNGVPQIVSHDISTVFPMKPDSMPQHNPEPAGVMELTNGWQISGDVTRVPIQQKLNQEVKQTNQTVASSLQQQRVQDWRKLEIHRKWNQNAVSIGSSYGESLGEAIPHQQVHSLAELMGMTGTTHDFYSNGTHDRSTSVVGKSMICPRPHAESNQSTYALVGTELHEDLDLHAHHNVGGYSLQEIPNSRDQVIYQHRFNLNLQPTLEGKSSTAAQPLPLGPGTPDVQRQSMNNQIIQVQHFLMDAIQERHKQNKIFSPPQPEILEREHNKLMVDAPVTSIATSSIPQDEKNNSDGGDEGIDLNKTPQQKPPKRKKHRPKVVVEGKPKRTPKPATVKNNTPGGNSTVKRAYVRRNGIKKSKTPLANSENVEVPDVEPAKKSCRRTLKFNLDDGAEKPSQDREFERQAESSKWSKHPLSFSEAQKYMSGTEKQQTGTAFPCFMNKISTRDATTSTLPTARDQTLNVIARSFNMRNASINQSSDKDACNQIHYDFSGPYLDSKRQPGLQAITQNQEDLLDLSGKQGFKSEYENNEMRQLQTSSFMGSKLFLHGLSEIDYNNRGSSGAWENGSEVGKKNKIEDKCDGTLSSTLSIAVVGEDLRQTKSQMKKNLHAQSSLVYNNDGVITINKSSKGINPDIRQRLQQHQAPIYEHLCTEGMTQKIFQQNAMGQIMNSGTMVIRWDGESAFQRCTKLNPIDETTSSPDHVTVKKRTAGQTSSKKVSIIDKIPRQDPTNSRSYGKSSKKNSGSQEKRILFSIDDLTSHFKDLQISYDHKEMILKEKSALVPYKVDGAIVPYKEFDPVRRRRPRPRVDLDPETNRLWNLLMGKGESESAEPMDTKKQKWWEEERKVFQGRVDSFIARMHLVQGDRRFSKWKGSVIDSVVGVFLTQNVSDHLSSSAFMCLAAKFPPKSKNAKESQPENEECLSVDHHEIHVTYPDETNDHSQIVMDSVYNQSSVTCTELSECRGANAGIGKEAFSPSKHTMRAEEDVISSQSSSESFIFQAPEDIRPSSGLNPEAGDGCIFSRKPGSLGISGRDQINVAYQQYKLQFNGSICPNKKSLIGHRQLENIVHKQNVEQASSSHAYSHSSVSESSQNQSSILQSANSWADMSIGLEKWEADFLASSGNKTLPSLTATNFEVTKGTGIEASNDNAGLCTEGSCSDIPDGRLKFQQLQACPAFSKGSSELITDLQNGSLNKTSSQGPQEKCYQASVLQLDPTRPAESGNLQQILPSLHSQCTKYDQLNSIAENWKSTCNTTPETAEIGHSTEERQACSSSKLSTKTTNAVKRKTHKEKTAPFNWDNLRKQAETKAGVKERSWEAMDSLDYEALRNANVHEISETIKERGMNNMLAERIKDFLNRLVQDHERMDLEWLRDVPPDKAKDYLLSIRGLGLKSVECVRLLTLHQLAFPVDTNVGRIAVRLGWVPLQPLPESLQLHLLELYPVLETIQKYLWPRLCQLDQETLYELHYQMITFGKVFCTKRQPNCNACPLRGECRHFASAFASARLALPEPEDRRIVTSSHPIGVNKSTDSTINHMPLPAPVGYIGQEMGLPRDCEPVIEEPTTPELPITMSERDIEDAFWEDPDEIPVIQLSVEEFTSNLQSFMRENMEIGEADMSKALVALSPNLASLPIPKLKNVSRLRTEHQVYELPDWHPLLEGMDRREADDPSPYLLAIWTPGETADSVQPPESKCISQGQGDLCNNGTCFSCNSIREARALTVRGTILIPCRTAMRGSFPLNGTYFQVNEVFADHDSSLTPIDVPRSLIWNLPRRTVFFGTSVSTIFKGLSTEDIQYCFWKGFVCVRGFDQKSRAPRPLMARLHFPASKMAKKNE